MVISHEPGDGCWGNQCPHLPQTECARIVCVSFAGKPQAGTAGKHGVLGPGRQMVNAGSQQGICKSGCVTPESTMCVPSLACQWSEDV